MSRTLMLALLAMTFAPLTCLAQFQQFSDFGTSADREGWKVHIKGPNELSVTGTLRLEMIGLDSALGHYKIKPEKIRAIQFSGEEDEEKVAVLGQMYDRSQGRAILPIQGTVITTSEDKIPGMIHVMGWQVETDLGTLTVDPTKLKEIEFLHEAKEKVEEEKQEAEAQEEAEAEAEGETKKEAEAQEVEPTTP
ncbi:hypothetical protein BH23PLA1_BH23PLA1_28280 [soil metagenome]